MSSAFCKHQVTQYTVTHAHPAGMHEDAYMVKEPLHWCRGCWYAVHAADESTQGLELFAVEELNFILCITDYFRDLPFETKTKTKTSSAKTKTNTKTLALETKTIGLECSRN